MKRFFLFCISAVALIALPNGVLAQNEGAAKIQNLRQELHSQESQLRQTLGISESFKKKREVAVQILTVRMNQLYELKEVVGSRDCADPLVVSSVSTAIESVLKIFETEKQAFATSQTIQDMQKIQEGNKKLREDSLAVMKESLKKFSQNCILNQLSDILTKHADRVIRVNAKILEFQKAGINTNPIQKHFIDYKESMSLVEGLYQDMINTEISKQKLESVKLHLNASRGHWKSMIAVAKNLLGEE